MLNVKAKNHCVSWLPFGGAVGAQEIGMNSMMADLLGMFVINLLIEYESIVYLITIFMNLFFWITFIYL